MENIEQGTGQEIPDVVKLDSPEIIIKDGGLEFSKQVISQFMRQNAAKAYKVRIKNDRNSMKKMARLGGLQKGINHKAKLQRELEERGEAIEGITLK